MAVLGAAPLYLDFKRLQLTGSHAAARSLISSLASDDEDLANMAGIFLVRAGTRSVPEIMKAIEGRDKTLPICLGILADIGDKRARATLIRFVSDPDPTVARAASDGLATVAMREKLARGEDPFSLDGQT